jgi:hypothetical protein
MKQIITQLVVNNNHVEIDGFENKYLNMLYLDILQIKHHASMHYANTNIFTVLSGVARVLQ